MKTRFDTKAVHEVGGLPADANGSVITPISLSTTFIKSLNVREDEKPQQFEYIRTGNPTRNRLEETIAQLEQAKHCAAFSSGMAAISAIFESIPFDGESGGIVLVSNDLYGGSYRFLEHLRVRHHLPNQYVSFWDDEATKEVVQKEKNLAMVWIETCTNPLLRIPNLIKLVEIVRHHHPNCIIVADNTFLSPYLMNPLEFGVDVVLHSVTKYINGHCDVLMGVLCTNDSKLFGRIKHFQNAIGNVPSPFDAYLVLRGIKTLAVRMQRHSSNALRLATFLQSHSAIERVIYPGLASHPDHEECKSVLREHGELGFGGMISVVIKGNVTLFLQALKLFSLAESLGGVESLIEVPATMSHSSIPQEKRAQLGIVDKLIRISVGIEHVDDLIDELNRALLASIQESS